MRTYISCPACYEYEYVLRKPRKVKYIFAVGGAVHKAWAHARRSWMAQLAASMDECLEQAMEGLVRSFQVGDLADPDPPDEVILQTDGRYRTPAAAEKDVLEIVPESLKARPFDVERGTFWQTSLAEYEIQVGIAQVEDKLDFGDLFPFPFVGFRDVRYRDGETRDLKTTSRDVKPDAFSAMQLATYLLLDFLRTGTIYPAGVDQVVKNSKFILNSYRLPATAEQLRRVQQAMLDAADGISAGRFPARPSFYCRYPESHGIPDFVSANTKEE